MEKIVKAKGGMVIDVTNPSGKNFRGGLNEDLKNTPKVSNAKRKAVMKKIRELKGIPIWNHL